MIKARVAFQRIIDFYKWLAGYAIAVAVGYFLGCAVTGFQIGLGILPGL